MLLALVGKPDAGPMPAAVMTAAFAVVTLTVSVGVVMVIQRSRWSRLLLGQRAPAIRPASAAGERTDPAGLVGRRRGAEFSDLSERRARALSGR